MFLLSHRALLSSLVTSLALVTTVAPAQAGIMSITPADLAGATLIDFGTTQTLAPINGQTITGVLFSYTVNGIPSAAAAIDAGPGNTNNITIANVVNVLGNNGAVLSMRFPSPETRMGYGYALLTPANVANATTVQLFNASNDLVGTLSVNGSPDPVFAGGFLGVKSDIPFVRANATFSTAGAAFAFDNLRFLFNAADVAVVPEPSSLALLATGVASLGAYCWSRRRLAARRP